MASSTEKKLQFAPWTSDIELAFYAALASLKINHDRLDDSVRKVLGLYELRPGDKAERSARMQIHSTALTTDEIPGGYYRAEGSIHNYNTIEDYKNANRTEALEKAGRTIWEAIHDETIYSCPSLLCSFYAVCFANLKKYKFTYHFAFPAIHSEPVWKLASGEESPTHFEKKETTLLVDAVQTWRYSVDPRQHGFFIAKRVQKYAHPPAIKGDEAEETRPKTPQTPGLHEELGFQWAVGSLSKFKDDFFQGVDKKDRFICFADPSNYSENPGWPLRNLLVLIRQLWQLSDVQILCYRDTHNRRDQANSLILHLQSDSAPEPSFSPGGSRKAPSMPKVTGWERNEANKVNNRTVDLAEYMDPQRLADQAVDLNLKLIKWRIAPNIDLDVVKNTSCLLLGAGTLGSYVSRNLMGWGVRKITFVDNGSVTFSNPVRQPLFDFKDCLDGGVKKAHRAADALTEIYPGVESIGHDMSVPMAGHPILDEAAVKADFDKLHALIEEHDVIFLLLDTRESRWLPTVMAKAAGKIVMNAALGFDSFVVMRHGLEARGEEEIELGCYFCNDVVAPADSVKDATLDQQCTVTRPGIAPIASALLVELLVSILQHPLRARAPHTASHTPPTPPSTFVHPLGGVPHQIRGFLSSWNNLIIEGKPYDSCSACSDKILKRYKEEGWAFVKRAINEKGWVEEVSGLAEVQRRAEELEGELSWDEEDGLGDDDGGGEGELL